MNRHALFWAMMLLAVGVGSGVYFGGGPRDVDVAKEVRPPEAPAGSDESGVAAMRTARPSVKTGTPSVDLETRLEQLEGAVAELRQAWRPGENDARRIEELEITVRELKSAMDGVNMEKASSDRQALFAGEDGYLKADEYFEAGKFAIAGEGYLTFVHNNPDHADAREVMKKARDAFLKAGYKDKAFWVQDEMMKTFPMNTAGEFEEVARIEKEAGMYDRAVEHMAQAAELSTHPEQRLWNRLYWAWYVKLRDGAPAGVAAIQQVQREIAASGVTNPKIHEKAAQHLSDWQLQSN